MTKTEFIEKYGDVEVAFSHYYKFVFVFSGELQDGSVLTCEYGGSSDSIYKFSLTANETVFVAALYPDAGQVIKDDILIEGFYEY